MLYLDIEKFTHHIGKQKNDKRLKDFIVRNESKQEKTRDEERYSCDKYITSFSIRFYFQKFH